MGDTFPLLNLVLHEKKNTDDSCFHFTTPRHPLVAKKKDNARSTAMAKKMDGPRSVSMA